MKTSEIIRVAAIEKEFPRPGNYEEIKTDIAARGIQESLVVNTQNQLLCGYTRLAIAEELGIEETPVRTVDITEQAAMIEYAILDNIRRRQLTDLELVEYGMRLEVIYGKRQGERTDLGTSCPEVGRTRDIVAAKIEEKTGAKMSGRKYDRLRSIAVNAAPEVKQKLNEGEISQRLALQLSVIDTETQLKVLKEAASGDSASVERVIQKSRSRLEEKARFEDECNEFLSAHAGFEKYREAILKKQLTIKGGIFDISRANLSVDPRKLEFAGQDFHFPMYSGQVYQSGVDVYCDSDIEKYPIFTEQEWKEVEEFFYESQNGYRVNNIVLEDRPFVRESPIQRRIYEHAYGNFLCDGVEIHYSPTGKRVYVRRGWGTWHVVSFNDGQGHRVKRRYFEHDSFFDTLVSLAFEAADPECFSEWDYRKLTFTRTAQYDMCWAYFRRGARKREDVIKALEQDLESLKSLTKLPPTEIERRAMELLDEYCIWIDIPRQFREGVVTVKRLPTGAMDVAFMEELYNKTHPRPSGQTQQDTSKGFVEFLNKRHQVQKNPTESGIMA